ncbi:MAG: hypothetical protein AAGM22_30200 [Acidobacteriota bacterium]
MEKQRWLLTSRTLVTVGALGFLGPTVRDTNASHLLNAHWVGHARFHLMSSPTWLARFAALRRVEGDRRERR